MTSALSLWAHAQTATAALPFARPAPRGVAHAVVELPIAGEGGVLVEATSFHRGGAPRPVVVVLHGVSGSSEDHYVVRAARAFLRAGFHVVRMNQRGTGLGQGKARQLGHAGFIEDLDILLRWLAARDDVSTIGVLGFSLGGHIALSLAADLAAAHTARHPKLRAVTSISAPIDLDESTRSFDALRAARFTGIYERLIVKSLQERARALKAYAGDAAPFTLDELAAVTTIRAFDDVVTCRTHGFANSDDYYARASVLHKLARIALPTLAIHADDDPMVPVHALRRAQEAANRSAAFDVDIVPSGGHVGFVSSLGHLWDASTAVSRSLEFLRRHLS